MSVSVYIHIMTCTHKHTGHGMPKECMNTPIYDGGDDAED